MTTDTLWTRYENNLLNNGISQNRIDKLRVMYITIGRGLNNKIENSTREDIENFVNDLHRNKFKKKDGKNFSGSSKSDIKKFLKQFYKWLKGNNETYPKEVSWIKTNIGKDEKPKVKDVLSIDEVIKLAEDFPKVEHKLITLILFDSGFRISELLSITKNDLTWEEYEPGKKCFWIKCNDSKTITRKIPIPLFTEDIQNFINSAYFKKLKPEDKVFPLSYNMYLQSLHRRDKKTVGKRVSFHNFRHSSATYYSKELNGNINSICMRYGWTLSSREAQTYIRLSGAYQKQTVKQIYSNEAEKLKEENKQLKEMMEKQQKEINELKVFMEDFKTIYRNPEKRKNFEEML